METQRTTILIVDDDEQVLIELERLLEDQGYNTTTAWSGRCTSLRTCAKNC